ncbi:MAG: hypothetical protein AABZ39_01760 [Spirochaetota bacterium]
MIRFSGEGNISARGAAAKHGIGADAAEKIGKRLAAKSCIVAADAVNDIAAAREKDGLLS